MECHKGFELLLRWLFPDQDDGSPQQKGRSFNETRLHFTVSVILMWTVADLLIEAEVFCQDFDA